MSTENLIRAALGTLLAMAMSMIGVQSSEKSSMADGTTQVILSLSKQLEHCHVDEE